MFRALSLALLMTLGLSLGEVVVATARANDAAITPSTQAHPHSYYTVLYRHDHHHRWRVYGEYRSHHEAHHAADHLRSHGYEVRIDQGF